MKEGAKPRASTISLFHQNKPFSIFHLPFPEKSIGHRSSVSGHLYLLPFTLSFCQCVAPTGLIGKIFLSLKNRSKTGELRIIFVSGIDIPDYQQFVPTGFFII